MPVAELVLRCVVAKSASVVRCSSRRSRITPSAPSASTRSFCQKYWRCVVLKGALPKLVCETESSLPSPAVSCDVQTSLMRFRLTALHVCTVVIVRSSKYGKPPSNCAFSRLPKYCNASPCPASHVQLRFAERFLV